MLILLLAAAAPASSEPIPISPLETLVTAADYPAGAMQHGVSGKVGFRLRVDATGKPDGCIVSQTSGSMELDNATCDLMLARARFKPALGPGSVPVRGDYSARIAWAVVNDPEPVTSEVIRVRSELDGAGKVVSCVAAPAEQAAQFGGCALFSDPRMLGHLTGRPLTGFAWIEMRIIKQASIEAPIADAVPAGAVKTVLARSTLTITPAGTIGGCTDDVVTRFDGRPLDLCAIGRVDQNIRFASTTGVQLRQLTIVMETVAQSR